MIFSIRTFETSPHCVQAALTVVALNAGKGKPGAKTPAPLVFARYLHALIVSGFQGGRDSLIPFALLFVPSPDLLMFIRGIINLFVQLNVLRFSW